MILPKITRKCHYWTYLFVGTLIIISAVFYQEYYFYKHQPGEVTKRVQQRYRIKESRITEELNFFEGQFSRAAGNMDFGELEKRQKFFEKEGLAFTVVKGDSLLFWTSSVIPGIENGKNEIYLVEPGVYKLQNGWFSILKKQVGPLSFYGFILIQQSYPFNNDYLKEAFQADFKVPSGTKITKTNWNNTIFSCTGNPLFNLVFTETIKPEQSVLTVLFLSYSMGFFVLLIFLYKISFHYKHIFPNRGVFLFIVVTEIIFIRILQFIFKVPGVVYNSELFSPKYYSSSAFLPSLGDLVIDCLILILVSSVFYVHYPEVIKEKFKPGESRKWPVYLNLLIFGIYLFLSVYLLNDLLVNSSFSLNLQNIASLKLPGIAGLIIISSILLSFFLVVSKLLESTIQLFLNPLSVQSKEKIRISLTGAVCYIFGVAIITTIVLNIHNYRTEQERRTLMAIKLGIERDPKAETIFFHQEKEMEKDSVFVTKFGTRQGLFGILEEDSICNAIRKKYFKSAWNNYSVQITLCSDQKMLRIQPQNSLYDCNSYFNNIIREYGKPTASNHLFFLDYGYGYKNYLSVFQINNKDKIGQPSGTAYIEISSKLVLKDQGYPGLLIDDKQGNIKDLSEYSYAFYRNKKLIQRYGNLDYSLELDHAVDQHQLQSHFYSNEGYNHFCYPINKEDFLIISKSEPTFMDKIAPFSYLFFFFSLFALIYFSILRFRSLFRTSFIRMGERIQFAMAGVIIISFFVVGIVIVLYVMQLNGRKNVENLNDRTHSILVELQHKFGSQGNISEKNNGDLNDLMTKLSNVFFTDINLFNTHGNLIATSRPEIFDEGMVSKRMNRRAFNQLKEAHSSFFILDEKIGGHHYNSAYMPLYSDSNNLLAYLNLPYFARQEEMKREISAFLVNFINAYAFLIILGVLISLIIASYITHPLTILTTKMGQISFGKNNEKIDWKRKDEIGKLIDEYNLMVEELTQSAEVIIRSEREGAWREMARQVAHEIKNPLTPMKLSIQHIERAWNDKAPDWEQRFMRFSQTMIEQIDALSLIAAEFSTFAQMPPAQNEQLYLEEVLRSIMVLYQNFPNINYVFTPESSGKQINADRKQLYRVFTNLINNAMHAIEAKGNDGMVKVSLNHEGNVLLVEITDNGIGIPPEQIERVFLPNFTTKSGGMGIGLAIVNNIIKEIGGTISLKSQKDQGTTFFLRFPSIEE